MAYNYANTLPPAAYALARTVSSTGALAGAPTSVTLNTLASFITVHAGPTYGIAFRWRKTGDTNAVTVASGSYPYDEFVQAGTSAQFSVPTDAVSISLDTMTTQPAIIVVEK